MLGLVLKCYLLLLIVAFCFCDGQMCTQGDVGLTANQCTEPDQLFNNTVSVLPGTNITLTCSLVETGVRWNSSQFTMPLRVDGVDMTAMESDITFQFGMLSTDSLCSNATATITSIQESMDGLDLSCFNIAPMAFTSTVMFDVIDPPDPVTSLNLIQICNDIIANWTASAPTNQSCPITGYSVNINVSGVVMSETTNQTNYTFSVNSSVCEKTFEISVSAISAAGTSIAKSSSIPVNCTPTDISVVNISDTSALVEWTHDMNISGVEEYKVMSVQSEDDPVTIDMLADVLMATVGVDSFTVDVKFVVTSLAAGNDVCFPIEKDLPAIKYENVVESDSNIGTVTFRFHHAVMEPSLLVSISPSSVNESCEWTLSEMAVIVSCFRLTNGLGYTVTLRGTLSVEETLLPFTFSESFTPTSSPSSPPTTVSVFTPGVIHVTMSSMSTRTSTATRPTTEPPTQSPEDSNLAAIAGASVGVLLLVLLIIAAIAIILIFCFKSKTRKVSLGREQEGDGDDPIALVEKKAKDPKTGEVGTYDGSNGQGKEVLHQQGPTGDEYAVVDNQAKRRAAPSTPQFDPMTYQDPHTIQRQEAPTGDLYALPNKEGKEPKEPMPVYSEVNKQPDRVYADLALPKGGDSGVNRQQPSQEVLYSQVEKM